MMSAKGFNDVGSTEAMRTFLRISSRFGPLNMGDMRSGSIHTLSLQEIEASVQDTSIVHAVFADAESVMAALNELKGAALGLSVTGNGNLEEIEKICHRLELRRAPHTVAFSLGVWGRLELLPPLAVLDICGLCGHSLISPWLVRLVANEVAEGRYSAEDGARKLAQPCICGAFNVERATPILQLLAGGRDVRLPERLVADEPTRPDEAGD